MTQIARNVTDVSEGFLCNKPDSRRDAKYSDEFRNLLVREGIYLVRLPRRSPNLNALAERFVRSIKSECLNRMTFFGKASLQQYRRLTSVDSLSG
jgi:putative transposase